MVSSGGPSTSNPAAVRRARATGKGREGESKLASLVAKFRDLRPEARGLGGYVSVLAQGFAESFAPATNLFKKSWLRLRSQVTSTPW